MGKKLIGIAVIAIMLFGIFGLTACDSISLNYYKMTGKALIDAHVATKTQSDYIAERWTELLNVAAEGKQSVDGATNKDEVDTAVDNTKIAINTVEESMGKFYTLQEARDNDLLSVEDLWSIAYYHNNGLKWEGELDWNLGGFQKSEFTPVPKNPNSLNEETENRIKQDFIKREKECKDTEHSVLIRYYGTYNGCIAAMINGCFGYAGLGQFDSNNDVIIWYGSNYRILIWKQI